MPNITFDFDDFRVLAGGDVTADELTERLPFMGCDLGGISGRGEVEVEFFPDRPDLFCVEGAARAYRAFSGRRPGLVTYDAPPSGIRMVVDPSVTDVRPYVVCAVVRDLELSDHGIKSLMDMQEKLHLTMGRKRAKVSIGVHDMDRVKSPFTYQGVEPSSRRFVPLEYGREMDLDEILREHPKGVDYAFILEGLERYPLITDADDGVLSFPPIINGQLTRLTEDSRNIFLDITGTDHSAVHGALTIVSSALADRGGKLFSVEVEYPDGTRVTPDMSPRSVGLDPEYVNSLLGTSFTPDEMAGHLERAGCGVAVKGDELDVSVPAYRQDILHPVDLVEDVAVGYGYDRFTGTLPGTFSMGAPLPRHRTDRRILMLMTGLGFTETKGLTLSSEEEQYVSLNRPDMGTSRILNPITVDHTILRTSLIPSLMGIFRVNRHRDLPQSIFELGTVVIDAKNRSRLAFAEISADASFTRCKSLVQAVLEGLGRPFTLEESLDEAFIPGRQARVLDGREGVDPDDMALGVFGEVHPRSLERFELRYPAVAAELDVDRLMRE